MGEFIPYKEAVKLKELGFNEPCMAKYDISLTEQSHEEDGKSGPFGWEKGEVLFSKEFFINNYKGVDHSDENWISVGAPTWRSAFEWLREKHGLMSHVERGENPTNYFPVIHNQSHKYNPKMWFEEYGVAELACLEGLIKIVEEKLTNSK